jgi:hypothetical protein
VGVQASEDRVLTRLDIGVGIPNGGILVRKYMLHSVDISEIFDQDMNRSVTHDQSSA